MNWNDFLKSKGNLIELIASLIILVISLSLFANFLNFVETRDGIVLPDPVLSLFNPVDLTWIIFVLIYFSLLLGIIALTKRPDKFLFAIQLYSLMMITRMVVMYLVPLNPPAGMILLKDPFVEFFGTGKTLTKDLFFSGHTATLFILFLVVDNKAVKTMFFITTIIVAISVLLQHVHYTIDVIAALVFTYVCYKILNVIKLYYYEH